MTKLNDTLYNIFRLTFRCPNQRLAEVAYEDLTWYINTGRASTDFIKALCRLKGNQQKALLMRMLKADYTTDDHIQAARQYLGA